MSPPDGSANGASKSPRSASRSRRRLGAMLIAAGSALGVTIAMAADSLSIYSFFSGPPATGRSVSSPATAGSSAPTPATHTPSDPSGAAAPTEPTGSPCANAAGTTVDCELPHRYESFNGECTVAGLVRWMGGRPDIDVVRAGVRAIDDGSCRADFRIDVTGSGSGALARSDAAVFRRCYDSRSNAVLSCNQPHTVEYVAASSPGMAKSGDCESAATGYLNIAAQRRSDELRVKRIESSPTAGDNARCVIEVLGSQRLAVSVRGIGQEQLHWVE